MSLIPVLFWLLPIGLIFVLFYRFNFADTTNKKVIGWLLLVFASIGGIVIFLLIHFTTTVSDKNSIGVPICLSTITPEDFNTIDLNNEQDIASVFYNKGFIRIEHKYSSANQYVYTLHDKYWDKTMGEEQNVLEYAFYNSDEPGELNYVLKKSEQFNSFFSYLKTMGSDSLLAKNFTNTFYFDKPCFKYKNSVFIRSGLISSGFTGYDIDVLKADKFLKISTNKKKSIQ